MVGPAFGQREHQIHAGRIAFERHGRDLKSVQRQAGGWIVVPGEVLPGQHDLHQRVMGHAAAGVEPLHQQLKGHILMLEGLQAACLNPAQ